MKFLATAAICVAAILVPAAAASPRSGNLHATKECTGFNGGPGSYCMITSSNLPAIEVGSKVLYLQPGNLFTPAGSDVVLDLPGPGNNAAYGNCSLAVGRCSFWGGTGKFTWFHASVAVSFLDGPNWAWDGHVRLLSAGRLTARVSDASASDTLSVRSRERPQQGRQREPVDLAVANQLAHAVDGHPFEPLDLVRVRGCDLFGTRADADADALIADARRGVIVTEQPDRPRSPARLVDRGPRRGRGGVFTLGDLAGRHVPAPLVGDEAIPPDEKQPTLDVRQNERHDLERDPDDVVIAARAVGQLEVRKRQPDGVALVQRPLPVHRPARHAPRLRAADPAG